MAGCFKKKRVFLFAILTLAIGACAAGPQIIKLAGGNSLAGEVAFSHSKHSSSEDGGGYGIACGKCHHSVWQTRGQPSNKCRSCHKGGSDKLKPMEEVAHTTCRGCHDRLAETNPGKDYATSCKNCHVYKEPSGK